MLQQREGVKQASASPWTIPSYLAEVEAVAVALIDEEGRLLKANRGFLRLLGDPADQPAGDARAYLQSPTWDELLDRPAHGRDRAVYRGLLTIGAGNAPGSTLHGEVRRDEGLFLFVGEHDLQDVERLTQTLLTVSEQLAEKQRALVRTNKLLTQREADYERMAASDELTGLANRRQLRRKLTEEIERSQRTGKPLGIVMVDVDAFKAFNEVWGRLAGDAALVALARVLEENTRPYDTVARYAGEEFVLVLPGSGLEAAVELAERLRQRLASLDLPDVSDHLTASFGVATRSGVDARALLEQVDAAMRAAKEAGGDRVQVAETD